MHLYLRRRTIQAVSFMINSRETHINSIQLVGRSLTVHSTFRPKIPKTDSSDDSASSLVSCLRTLSVANITQPRWYRNEMLAGGRRGTLRVGKTGDRPGETMPTQHSNLKKLTVAQPFKKSPVIYANIRFVTSYKQ